jgi:hypothetical protein
MIGMSRVNDLALPLLTGNMPDDHDLVLKVGRHRGQLHARRQALVGRSRVLGFRKHDGMSRLTRVRPDADDRRTTRKTLIGSTAATPRAGRAIAGVLTAPTGPLTTPITRGSVGTLAAPVTRRAFAARRQALVGIVTPTREALIGVAIPIVDFADEDSFYHS